MEELHRYNSCFEILDSGLDCSSAHLFSLLGVPERAFGAIRTRASLGELGTVQSVLHSALEVVLGEGGKGTIET